MRDLTAMLMGDPGSSPRRAPTQQEIEQMKARTAHDQKRGHKRYSPLHDWRLGEVRTFSTWREAKSKQDGLYQKGMLGALRSIGDGAYTVMRVQ